MELENKKYLAEWMGWKYVGGNVVDFFHPSHDRKIIEVKKWNPDTDHKQFAEVRHNISDFVWERIKQAYFSQHLSERQGNFEDAILFYLPKVMEAVLEVIRDEVKE